MQKVLHLKATVLPGGRIEVVDKALRAGESVDVVVLPTTTSSRRSAVDILEEAHGQRLFKTASDVESYIQAERASWQR